MSFLREIIENIKLADWNTFSEEAAAMHIFMAFTRDDEAKRACYKILSDLPQGDNEMRLRKRSLPSVNSGGIWLPTAGANASIAADMVTNLRFVELGLSRIDQNL